MSTERFSGLLFFSHGVAVLLCVERSRIATLFPSSKVNRRVIFFPEFLEIGVFPDRSPFFPEHQIFSALHVATCTVFPSRWSDVTSFFFFGGENSGDLEEGRSILLENGPASFFSHFTRAGNPFWLLIIEWTRSNPSSQGGPDVEMAPFPVSHVAGELPPPSRSRESFP